MALLVDTINLIIHGPAYIGLPVAVMRLRNPLPTGKK